MILNDDNKRILDKFVEFVKNELDIKIMPTIVIQNGRKDLKTTANYDYMKKNKIIKINGKNRALVDVLRSLGHELTHHKQFEQGRLKVKPPDIGGEIEDEANAKAGQFIKMFGRENQIIYEGKHSRKVLVEGLKVMLSEKQLKTLLKSYKEEDIDEQDDTSDAEPTSGASDTQSGGDGYPDVTTWEEIGGSKVTRGPANQIKNTKWSDIVGSTLKRDVANQLK